MSLHSFEVPLFAEPSPHFKRFIREIVPSDLSSLFVSYWCDKLTFTFHSKKDKEAKEHMASLKPFPPTFDGEQKKKLQKVLSSFASKFNCSFALVGPDCNVHLSLTGSSDLSDPTVYGDGLVALLTVTVICDSVAVEMALNNFFMVIDTSGNKDISD